MGKNVYILNETSINSHNGIKSYVDQFSNYFLNSEFHIHIIDLCLEQKEFVIKREQNIVTYHIPIQWEMSIKKKRRYYRNIFYLLEPYLKNSIDGLFIINLFIHDEIVHLIKDKYSNMRILFIVHYLDSCFKVIKENCSYSDIMIDLKNNLGFESYYHELIIRDKYIFDHVDKIICLSMATKRILQKFYALNDKKVSVVYNGLSDEAKFLSETKKQLLKNNLLFNENDQIVLYVGRLDPYKGVFELIGAFKKITKINSNARLILVGGGNIDLFMKECQGYWSRIFFTGHISKESVYKFYQIATIGVLPSYTEQCSYAAIEMMMHGLPIIGTTANGIKEMIEDEKSGYTVELKDVAGKQMLNIDKLATRIEELLSDKTKRDSFSKQSRMRYESYYKLSIMGNKMEEILYEK